MVVVVGRAGRQTDQSTRAKRETKRLMLAATPPSGSDRRETKVETVGSHGKRTDVRGQTPFFERMRLEKEREGERFRERHFSRLQGCWSGLVVPAVIA